MSTLEIFRRWYRERLLSKKELSILRRWGRQSGYVDPMSARVIVFIINVEDEEFAIGVEGEGTLEDRTPGRWRAVRAEGAGAPLTLAIAMDPGEDEEDAPVPDPDELAEEYQGALRASTSLHAAVRRGIPLLDAILLGALGLGWESESGEDEGLPPASPLTAHVESLVKCLHSTLRKGPRYLEMAHTGEEEVRVRSSGGEELTASVEVVLSASRTLLEERGWEVDACEAL